MSWNLIASATCFTLAAYGGLVVESWVIMSAEAAKAGGTLTTQQVNQLGVIRVDAWFLAGFFLLCYLAVAFAVRSRLRCDSTPRLVVVALLTGVLAAWTAGPITYGLDRAFGGMTPLWVEISSSALVTIALVAVGFYLVCRPRLETTAAE